MSTVTLTGGAGELEHLSADGTYVYDEAGAPFAGSAHGIRIVVRPRGTLRSPVLFLNGNETLEPIDTSGDHTTVKLNGGSPKPMPGSNYEFVRVHVPGKRLHGERLVWRQLCVPTGVDKALTRKGQRRRTLRRPDPVHHMDRLEELLGELLARRGEVLEERGEHAGRHVGADHLAVLVDTDLLVREDVLELDLVVVARRAPR